MCVCVGMWLVNGRSCGQFWEGVTAVVEEERGVVSECDLELQGDLVFT